MRLALDTNILLDLARGAANSTEFMEKANNLPDVVVGITPTVRLELAYFTSDDFLNKTDIRSESELQRVLELSRSAGDALTHLDSWGIVEFDVLEPSTEGSEMLLDALAQKMLDDGLLPPHERHDATIVVEAASWECNALITRDTHMTNMSLRGSKALDVLLAKMGLVAPTLMHPGPARSRLLGQPSVGLSVG